MSERVRFQADANFNAVIVKGALRREPQIDIQSAADTGLAGIPDSEVLARAAQADRALVSHAYHTMSGHCADFLASGQHSPGIFLLHQDCASCAGDRGDTARMGSQ
jgi:hypothetical protein